MQSCILPHPDISMLTMVIKVGIIQNQHETRGILLTLQCVCRVPTEIGMPKYRGMLCIIFPGNIYLRIYNYGKCDDVATCRVHFNKLCEEQTMCVETREMHFSVNNFCCFNYCHYPPKGT